MTPEDIYVAIGAHLATMTDAPTIIREAQNADPARPYISFSHHLIMRTRPGLSGGGSVVQSGFVALSIVTAWGQNSTEANDIAALVMARFPKGLRLPVAGSAITIRDEPRINGSGIHSIDAGYRDMQDWRLPMQIDYRAIS